MDSPRLGFRRAAATSWALVGVGVAGVAGASALAYTDTVKPAVADVPAEAAIPAPEDLSRRPPRTSPPAPVVTAPDVVPTADRPIPAIASPPAPEYTAQTPVEQAPVPTQTPVTEYTPQYTPDQTVEQSPPVTHQAPATQAQAPPDDQAAQSHPDDGDGAELLPARHECPTARDRRPRAGHRHQRGHCDNALAALEYGHADRRHRSRFAARRPPGGRRRTRRHRDCRVAISARLRDQCPRNISRPADRGQRDAGRAARRRADGGPPDRR